MPLQPLDVTVGDPEALARRLDGEHIRALLAGGWTTALIAATYEVPIDVIADLALEGY